MKDTKQQFEHVIAVCRDLFSKKLHDYGPAWRILRPSSVTDQIFIKANRIRSIETKGVTLVDEGIRSEFIAIVNYGIVGLIQLELGYAEAADMTNEEALVLYELYKIKAFLKNQNLKVTLLLIDMEEYKLLNGWSYDKKRGSVRYDRIPIGIRKIVELDCPQDYMQFVPEGLEKNFTSADFANAAHIDRQTAASVLAMLNYMEQVKRVGKTGNAYIYDIEEHY